MPGDGYEAEQRPIAEQRRTALAMPSAGALRCTRRPRHASAVRGSPGRLAKAVAEPGRGRTRRTPGNPPGRAAREHLPGPADPGSASATPDDAASEAGVDRCEERTGPAPRPSRRERQEDAGRWAHHSALGAPSVLTDDHDGHRQPRNRSGPRVDTLTCVLPLVIASLPGCWIQFAAG